MPEKKSTRSILVYLDDGRRVLVEDIPGNAKVTFGKLQPGDKGFDPSKALRIYTVESNQLAVFTGVSSFRDLSLKVFEQKITRELKSDAVAGPNGRYSAEQYEERRSWEEAGVDHSEPGMAKRSGVINLPAFPGMDAF